MQKRALTDLVAILGILTILAVLSWWIPWSIKQPREQISDKAAESEVYHGCIQR